MRKLALAAALLISIGAELHAQSSDADADLAVFNRAVQLQEAGDLEAAASEYQRFLVSQPRNIEALSNLGVIQARLGRYDEAITAYRKALEFAPNNASVRMNLALAFYKSGRCADAMGEFDMVLGSNPGHPNVLLLKGDCLVQMGEYKRAADLLAPLESTHAEERVFNYVYGMALLQDGRTEAGLKQIDRILKDGDSAEAHLMMGISQRMAADYGAARDEFKRAIERNPDLPLAHSLYGQMLLTTGDREGARQAFARELTSNPGDFDANLYTGVILKEEQRIDEARRFFERALQARPGDPGARYQMATVYLSTGENTRALELLEALVAESPAFIEARVSLATVYYRLKRKADGDREREKVAELTRAAQAKQPAPAAEAPSTVVPPQDRP
jgi:tetratricopeptide (TPR) repeat protein